MRSSKTAPKLPTARAGWGPPQPGPAHPGLSWDPQSLSRTNGSNYATCSLAHIPGQNRSWKTSPGSGRGLSQAGQALTQLTQLKQPDVQQLCRPAHLGPRPLPLCPCLLQAALRRPQLLFQFRIAGLQVLPGKGGQGWGPQQITSPARGVQSLTTFMSLFCPKPS